MCNARERASEKEIYYFSFFYAFFMHVFLFLMLSFEKNTIEKFAER